MTTARVALAALLLLAGCASGGGGDDVPMRWGGIVEDAPPPPGELKGALSVPTPSVAPYPEREFSEQEKAFFESAWSAFKLQAPEWPDLKARWMSLGAEAQGLLAVNLYRAMVASRAGGELRLLETAKRELTILGEGAVPVLVGGLSVRAIRRDNGEEIRVGQEVLHDAAESLSIIGATSVPGLLDIAGSGEKVLVQEAVWALGNIGDPRAEELILRLSRQGDEQVRAVAVLALRRYADAAARVRLVEALEDPEFAVCECAARALVTGRRRDALPEVAEVLDRATRAGNIAGARSAQWVLEKVTGQKLGGDAAAWRQWLAGNP